MKDRIFENSLNIIRNYLKEDVPTTSISSGGIAGTETDKNGPPVDLRKNKYKNLPGPYKDLFRRTSSVKSKHPR
jgi:hypothetical protein